MTVLHLAPRARADIREALRHSRETFGANAHRRYAQLIDQALTDLTTVPDRAGVREVADNLWIYHLRASARRAPKGDRVARPRHMLVFRHDANRLIVIRMLDDRMDFWPHVGG